MLDAIIIQNTNNKMIRRIEPFRLFLFIIYSCKRFITNMIQQID